MGAVTRAVPSAVAPSSGSSVPVRSGPQLGPYKPMTGSGTAPAVPAVGDQAQPPSQPGLGGLGGAPGRLAVSGSEGAPTVPPEGFLYKQGPIDAHYTAVTETIDPYRKVNAPRVRGALNFIRTYVNGIGLGTQNREATGWNSRQAQQRTSYMRITPPPHGAGYAPAFFTPRQQPIPVPVYKYPPVTGTVPYGHGTLNSDQFGAGQTAGGQGGNRYTPQPGPPDTTAVTPANQPPPGGMPTWG